MCGHRRGKPAAEMALDGRLNSQVKGPCTFEPLESLRTPKEHKSLRSQDRGTRQPLMRVLFFNRDGIF